MLPIARRRHFCTAVIDFVTLYKPGGIAYALDQLRNGKGDFTIYTRILRHCRDEGTLLQGKALHAGIIRDGFQHDSVLGNLLVEMYIRRGSTDAAGQALDQVPNKSVTTWTRLLAAFAHSGQCNEAFALFRKMQLEGWPSNNITFVTILGLCNTLEEVRKFHSYAMELVRWVLDDVFLGTAILTAYGKFGGLHEALSVFNEMLFQDLVAWTALLQAYAQNGYCSEAVEIYRLLLCEGVCANRVTLLAMVTACTMYGNTSECKMVHSHVKESGWHTVDAAINNAIICMFDKCGNLEDAKSTFDEMPIRDFISWTSLISAYAQRGKCIEAFHLSRLMKLDGERPNNVTIMALLDAASFANFSSIISEVELVHRHIVEDGWDLNVVVATSLVTTYGRFKQSLEHALAIFRKLYTNKKDDIILWNSMMSSYAQHGFRSETLALLEDLEHRFHLDNVSFVAALSVLAGSEWLYKGRILHESVVKHGYEKDLVVANAVVTMYGKCGSVREAADFFETMTARSTVNWNGMVCACLQNGETTAAFWYFRRMQLEGVAPDASGLNAMLYGCASPDALADGKLLAAQVLARGFSKDTALANALIVMYARCGDLEQAVASFRDMVAVRDIASWNALITAYGLHSKLEEAKQVFLGMQVRDVASWNAMLAVLAAQKDSAAETFLGFQNMQVDGVVPNTATLITVLQACASSGGLPLGRLAHRFAVENSLSVASATVNMYAKHGCLVEARRVFDEEVQGRDVVTWNSLLVGYSQHGHGLEALVLFQVMQQEGMIPDKSTFVTVLHACSHLGWVKEGCKQFNCISDDYGFVPHDEHYNCVVDMLGRAGHLQDAEEIVRKVMQMRAGVVTWTTLLSSCRIHGDLVRGTKVAKKAAAYESNHSTANLLYELETASMKT